MFRATITNLRDKCNHLDAFRGSTIMAMPGDTGEDIFTCLVCKKTDLKAKGMRYNQEMIDYVRMVEIAIGASPVEATEYCAALESIINVDARFKKSFDDMLMGSLDLCISMMMFNYKDDELEKVRQAIVLFKKSKTSDIRYTLIPCKKGIFIIPISQREVVL